MGRPTGQVRRARPERDDTESMAREVREGLLAPLPSLPSKYFYDDRGSALFEEITRLPEYYQTRTEEAILEAVADEVLERARPRELAELGSGAGRKIRILLDGLARRGTLERCLLMDINDRFLRESAKRLQAAYPSAEVRGVLGDFTEDLDDLGPGGGRLLLFFAGTLGNLHPEAVPGFFARAARVLEAGDSFLVGVDLVKDAARLEAAYNDAAGVTARFNLNILQVVNDRLGADFDPGAFEHVAFYDEANAWIEMRLRARRPCRVSVPGAGVGLRFERGQEIRTELSCKYTRGSLEGLLGGTGLVLDRWFTDPEGLFALALLRRDGDGERVKGTRAPSAHPVPAPEAARLLGPFRDAWRRSDSLFALLAEGALLEQPIPLRQPFIFYLGHLPVFAWNHLGRRGLGEGPLREDFEALFERGIDPIGVDAYQAAASWPAVADVLAYRDAVRSRIGRALERGDATGDRAAVGLMVLEHELMHQETLLYMVQRLPHHRKRRPLGAVSLPPGKGRPGGRVRVPAGTAVLGARRGTIPFGWDNEFPEHEVEVPGFVIDRTPVTNADFLAFVEADGYRERRLWDGEGWAWRERAGLRHPAVWSEGPAGWAYRTLFEDVPLLRVADWPVYVSGAEAAAYAAWQGARLPTEAEFHRAAYGSPEGPRPWPWGAAPPAPHHGNFGFHRWSPTAVGGFPEGASAWGALGLAGNGWEWTSTPFAPFAGFERMPGYPGYSADFFDGRHHVLLGASWATDLRLVRRSFRNWFQVHYPYVFAKFRCVRA